MFGVISLLFVVGSASAYANNNVVSVGEERLFDAGTHGYYVRPLSFKGQHIGYASSEHLPLQFSRKYSVYESCMHTPNNEDSDGYCGQWKVLYTDTGRIVNLSLPGFDGFWAAPAFFWPYVAYIQVGNLRSKQEQDVYCVVYDFANRRIIKRERRFVPSDKFATDMPGLFPAPKGALHNGTYRFVFGVDTGSGNSEDSPDLLCSLSVP